MGIAVDGLAVEGHAIGFIDVEQLNAGAVGADVIRVAGQGRGGCPDGPLIGAVTQQVGRDLVAADHVVGIATAVGLVEVLLEDAHVDAGHGVVDDRSIAGVEGQHAAHVLEELEETYFDEGFDRAKFFKGGKEILDAVATFWDGLEADRVNKHSKPGK